MDRRRRESEGKAKIEGYMSVADEEAHQRFEVGCLLLGLEGMNIFFENTLILKEVKFCEIHKYLIVQFTRLW